MGGPRDCSDRHRVALHQRPGESPRQLPNLHSTVCEPLAPRDLRVRFIRHPPLNCLRSHNVFHYALGGTCHLITQERSISTVITLADFFISNTIAQVGYCLVWLLVYIVSEDYATGMHSNGLWVMWITYLVRICESDRQGNIQMCCLPFVIKKRLYPLVTMVLVGIINWQIPFDLLMAYLLGIIACRWFDGSFIKLTYNAYRKLEASCLVSWMSNRSDFCPIDISPKARYFCSDNAHDYREFFKNFSAASN